MTTTPAPTSATRRRRRIDPHPLMALGFSHSCSRMLDSTVRCWGSDFSGELGDGVSLDASARRPRTTCSIAEERCRASPTRSRSRPGTDHTCIVHKTGKVSCWGDNFGGELGNGTTDSSSTPVDVQGSPTRSTSARAAASRVPSTADKTASCWGSNPNGGLGDGTTTDSNKPVKVNELTNVIDIRPSTNSDLRAHDERRRLLLGRRQRRPARDRLDPRHDDADEAQRALEHRADRRRLAIRVCAATSRQRLLLGPQRHRPARQRQPDAGAEPVADRRAANLTDAASRSGPATATRCAARARTAKSMCWGDGTDGQLGIGPVDANGQSSPTPVPVPGVSRRQDRLRWRRPHLHRDRDEYGPVLGRERRRRDRQRLDRPGEQDTPAAVNNFP